MDEKITLRKNPTLKSTSQKTCVAHNTGRPNTRNIGRLKTKFPKRDYLTLNGSHQRESERESET